MGDQSAIAEYISTLNESEAEAMRKDQVHRLYTHFLSSYVPDDAFQRAFLAHKIFERMYATAIKMEAE